MTSTGTTEELTRDQQDALVDEFYRLAPGTQVSISGRLTGTGYSNAAATRCTEIAALLGRDAVAMWRGIG